MTWGSLEGSILKRTLGTLRLLVRVAKQGDDIRSWVCRRVLCRFAISLGRRGA